MRIRFVFVLLDLLITAFFTCANRHLSECAKWPVKSSATANASISTSGSKRSDFV